MTVWTDNAQQFATRRGTLMAQATADHILQLGCRRAVDALRDEDLTLEHAVLALADAQRRAERLLHQTAVVSTSTPEAAARPDAHPEGEAGGRPVTYLDRRRPR